MELPYHHIYSEVFNSKIHNFIDIRKNLKKIKWVKKEEVLFLQKCHIVVLKFHNKKII